MEKTLNKPEPNSTIARKYKTGKKKKATLARTFWWVEGKQVL